MKNIFQDLKRKDHKRYLGGLDVFKYIGPGLLVTVGFIDPRASVERIFPSFIHLKFLLTLMLYILMDR